MVKYWDMSLLGHLQGVSKGGVVSEGQGFPEVRSFSAHSVRRFFFFVPECRLRNLRNPGLRSFYCVVP